MSVHVNAIRIQHFPSSSPAPKKAMTPDVIRVQKDGLEVERLKFTEAAVKLGRERAEFEVRRIFSHRLDN